MAKAIQDNYPEDYSHCYGCGSLNNHGLQLKTYWEGDETVSRFTPRKYHMAIPGYVYGGLIASLIDCHGTGTAAAALNRAKGLESDIEPSIRCLTASLKVDYLRPTPLGTELVVRGHVEEISGRRVTVVCALYADDVECVRGQVIAVQVPDSFIDQLAAEARL